MRRNGQTGQAAAEYVGMLVVVLAIVLMVAQSGVSVDISGRLGVLAADIAGDEADSPPAAAGRDVAAPWSMLAVRRSRIGPAIAHVAGTTNPGPRPVAGVREQAAREALIRAGHIPPPGPMTDDEAERFLHAYELEHHTLFGGGERLQILGRLSQGYTIEFKPEWMTEPEWMRRSRIAMDVLSLIPVGRSGKVARALAMRLGSRAAESAVALRVEAEEAVGRAVAQVGEGSGPAYGSRVHKALEQQIAGSPDLRAEVSYLKGREVDFGTKGSIRVDVVALRDGHPTAVFDLKTGSAKLTASRILQIQQHLPANMRNVTIEEIRPK
jgi:hypothetical protein